MLYSARVEKTNFLDAVEERTQRKHQSCCPNDGVEFAVVNMKGLMSFATETDKHAHDPMCVPTSSYAIKPGDPPRHFALRSHLCIAILNIIMSAESLYEREL